MAITSKGISSLIDRDGVLHLSLVETPLDDPGPGEVLVRIEAAPINPSDLFLLTGPMIPGTARYAGSDAWPEIHAGIVPGALPGLAPRLDRPTPVGTEGAGVVVAAGAGCEHLLGRLVTMVASGLYADYRLLPGAACRVLPEGVSAAQGAAAYVNPMTALSMVETMRRDGRHAMVNTAAASMLGQMLNRLCLADGVPLVNVVRSAAQRDLLLAQGALHVVDSSAPDFVAALTEAIAETGARVAFDAIGGGGMADTILTCMERIETRGATDYNRYGSNAFKQVYVYGVLDPSPTQLRRQFGFAWGVSGWLLTWFLQKIGPEAAAALQSRALDEITTTFATRYTDTITLADALRQPAFEAYHARATGRKYLIMPHKAQ